MTKFRSGLDKITAYYIRLLTISAGCGRSILVGTLNTCQHKPFFVQTQYYVYIAIRTFIWAELLEFGINESGATFFSSPVPVPNLLCAVLLLCISFYYLNCWAIKRLYIQGFKSIYGSVSFLFSLPAKSIYFAAYVPSVLDKFIGCEKEFSFCNFVPYFSFEEHVPSAAGIAKKKKIGQLALAVSPHTSLMSTETGKYII